VKVGQKGKLKGKGIKNLSPFPLTLYLPKPVQFFEVFLRLLQRSNAIFEMAVEAGGASTKIIDSKRTDCL
jgi:hypothetical protein